MIFIFVYDNFYSDPLRSDNILRLFVENNLIRFIFIYNDLCENRGLRKYPAIIVFRIISTIYLCICINNVRNTDLEKKNNI